VSEKPDTPVECVEEFIGDGLYVSFDGWQIWLRTPRPEGDHRIAMEPDVWRSLRAWIDHYPRLKKHMEGK
jgi:hypothetical protein